MSGELGAAVACALARLPEKLRAAIVLVTLEQLDPAEAARIEGCTRATIYWRLHEARKRLAEWLQGHLP
jgi:RNA polymerase sigma-70 factor (ECF subfamily)